MSATAKTKWSLEADYVQACNCDYGCPCEFEARPTMGFCDGMGAWRINRGRHGDLALDGLALGFVAHWPGALHEGNGTLALFFEQKSNPKQREALMRIATGQEVGICCFGEGRSRPGGRVEFRLSEQGRFCHAGQIRELKLEPGLQAVSLAK